MGFDNLAYPIKSLLSSYKPTSVTNVGNKLEVKLSFKLPAVFGLNTVTFSVRFNSLLKLPKSAEISMVIGCGIREEDGLYGERFRLPLKEVYFSK